MLQRAIWVPTRLLLRYFIHLEIEGTDNIKNLPRGIIFALNHSSELDPIVLPASFPFLSRHFPMFYTSRERSFYKNSSWRKLFYGGALFKFWGAYPVQAGQHNYEASLETHIEILNHKNSLCIFPEGYKTRDGNLGKGKGGVAYLSFKTGLPVVPVALTNLWKIGFKNFILRRRYTVISFGAPIYPKDLFAFCGGAPKITPDRNDFVIAADLVMRNIATLLAVAENLTPPNISVKFPSGNKRYEKQTTTPINAGTSADPMGSAVKKR
ncbi:MAG: hypothetical protein A2664_03420 [Candidatus Taylorbacteria bacterium RIFCSPHIGHO2_01_FULL_46_22b]|uniref:Phospholipid/glycerol acyltransferase domain-containing protein n=1 Tax=Candidatus Taylorbacteria bacterium RIFCSPHIGHO2_01_FULL_46_22b TaxID=1802301 RepID=A0A1G2M1K4_9BACT|nr:MAG: hypothetical protein A2664_03420 [Candidatus Taylorbacteria bacterium RIFCSPHIGHO2_01_FULL_46_22b]